MRIKNKALPLIAFRDGNQSNPGLAFLPLDAEKVADAG